MSFMYFSMNDESRSSRGVRALGTSFSERSRPSVFVIRTGSQRPGRPENFLEVDFRCLFELCRPEKRTTKGSVEICPSKFFVSCTQASSRRDQFLHVKKSYFPSSKISVCICMYVCVCVLKVLFDYHKIYVKEYSSNIRLKLKERDLEV